MLLSPSQRILSGLFLKTWQTMDCIYIAFYLFSTLSHSLIQLHISATIKVQAWVLGKIYDSMSFSSIRPSWVDQSSLMSWLIIMWKKVECHFQEFLFQVHPAILEKNTFLYPKITYLSIKCPESEIHYFSNSLIQEVSVLQNRQHTYEHTHTHFEVTPSSELICTAQPLCWLCLEFEVEAFEL